MPMRNNSAMGYILAILKDTKIEVNLRNLIYKKKVKLIPDTR
jgi:hypothetical protein